MAMPLGGRIGIPKNRHNLVLCAEFQVFTVSLVNVEQVPPLVANLELVRLVEESKLVQPRDRLKPASVISFWRRVVFIDKYVTVVIDRPLSMYPMISFWRFVRSSPVVSFRHVEA
jgi:hypothetical protein